MIEKMPLGFDFNDLVQQYYRGSHDKRGLRLGQWICNTYLHTLGSMMTWPELYYAKNTWDAKEAYHHTEPTKITGP